jgi:ABC-type dipeptide/oligopeptide/nickel transport system ATPase component
MYVSTEEMPIFCLGIENCSVLALSLKSHVRRASERNLTKAAVKYAVDNMPLKAIVVYSGCGKDETALAILKYATDNGIKIIIPENSLRERNRGRCA